MRCLFEINGTELLSSFLKNETKNVSLEKNYYFHTPTKKIFICSWSINTLLNAAQIIKLVDSKPNTLVSQ